MGGIVDQHVDSSERRNGLIDHRPGMSRIADVAGDQQRLSSGALDELLRLRGIFVLVEIGDRDIGSLACVRQRDRPADPTVTTGNQGLALDQTAMPT